MNDQLVAKSVYRFWNPPLYWSSGPYIFSFYIIVVLYFTYASSFECL